MRDFQTLRVPGRLTELRCGCGGQLRAVRTVIVPAGDPPHHRKRRIRKKWRKRWEAERRVAARVGVMMGLMQRPAYRCETCGRATGFYSAAVRNLIQVEQLPEGARPVYDREPGG